MDRSDFGLILQAAATRSFDFTQVGPKYFTRLALVLAELKRLNKAQAAAHAALHCVISTVMVDDESRKENYTRMQYNRQLMMKLLRLPVPKEATAQDTFEQLKQTWYDMYGDTHGKRVATN